MKLRRIDILGFKSFRNRTAIEVADGVTSIVGPNGCGKSNVVDAIRWALGSQSAKDLRGRAMEDVIFAGSDSHKPMSLAEVSLTLDNDRLDLPGEWRQVPEVKITRRLFRTGESEYEINGARARLRDVQEIFLGTGVGSREAYSIIEQGRIGFIVSARPEERRVIIEEAAGITRYRFQRKTAERKLEKTRENLTRIRDILSEVARQLSSLERQAKRAAQVRELTSRRLSLEITQAIDRRDRTWALLQEQTAALDGLRESVRAASTQLRILEAQSETLRIEYAVQERRLNELTEETYRLRSKAELLASNVQFQERERDQLRERAEQTERETGERELELSQAVDEQANGRALETRLTESLQTAREALDARSETLLEVRERLAAANDEARRLSGELNRQRGVVAQASGRLDSTESERRRIAERRLSLAEEQSGLRQEAVRLAERGRLAGDDLEGLEQAAVANEERFHAARTHESELLRKLDAARNEERTARQALRSVEVELQGFEASLKSGRGIGDAARRLLDAATRGEVAGILRPLAERLRVPEDRDAELSAALDRWMDAVLVEDDAALRAAARWCRHHKLAITLIAMHDPHVGSLGDYGVAFEAVPGVVLQRLLARHPVADVLEGEPVVPAVDRRRGLMPARGVLELGTDAASAAEIVFRLRRQADDARVKLEGCQARASGAEEAVREMERQLESAMQLRSALRDELESARLRLDQNRRAVAEARRDAEQAENAEARIRAEIDSIEGRQEDLQELGETLAREIETSGIQIRQLEQQVDHAQTLASALQDESQRAGDLLSDARLQVSRLQEQLRLNQDLVARLERTSREVTGRLALLRQEAESTRKRAAELDARLSRDIEGRAEAEALRIASEEQLARLREKFDVVAAGLRDADADILAQRKTMETAQEALRGQEFAAERSRAELEVIEQTLAERFQTGIEQARELAIAGGMTDALRSELVALNASIEKLGPVNPAAEEEYEEARERHAFMGGQRADLETALGDLESAIRKMDKTSRDLFEETFHAVNQRFQEVFPLLFNGGKARMELTDPDNLLETGVDIIVQPPGKRLQSMTLLSGGEKALSAVALIFAIFQLRPTPFCILDEVDAPLDEANVIRFAELVQRMAGTSQFMIITHNKRTMEAAHTLYGVTMEEPGVSKIVGVRLPSRDTPLT